MFQFVPWPPGSQCESLFIRDIFVARRLGGCVHLSLAASARRGREERLATRPPDRGATRSIRLRLWATARYISGLQPACLAVCDEGGIALARFVASAWFGHVVTSFSYLETSPVGT